MNIDIEKLAEQRYPTNGKEILIKVSNIDYQRSIQEGYISGFKAAKSQQQGNPVSYGELKKMAEKFWEKSNLEYKQDYFIAGFREAEKQRADENQRLKAENNELRMSDMTHEYNEAEAEKFRPEYERQLLEPLQEEIQRLKKSIDTAKVCWRAEMTDRMEKEASIQELCGVLDELVPIAERMQSACESGESICYDNDYDQADAMYYLSKIEAAKQALQKHKQVI